ncbi:recombinase family protein [Thalassomonas sp. M1454]|uniref:recombinase family protein n=1 Tax=Thalassomonas sp. M1454 TaxID=2594477 RepID=UPI0011807B04|nr:recombinase family protein [Thalassomonas sp. M1454]TRX53468.1 resolvase [Thalassomonas sp. M1454]
MNYVSYLRVSTIKQGESGLGLEAQKHSVKTFIGSQDQATLLEEYVEIESGKKSDRKVLDAAIRHCKLTNSILLIAKLDRLTRDLHFLTGLMKEKIKFIACDNPHANELTVQLLAVVAENEARQVSVRTKAALAAAKARGVILGNPNLDEVRCTDTTNARKTFIENTQIFYEHIYPVITDIQGRGIVSYRGIARELNRLGFKSRRGAGFTDVVVKKIVTSNY